MNSEIEHGEFPSLKKGVPNGCKKTLLNRLWALKRSRPPCREGFPRPRVRREGGSGGTHHDCWSCGFSEEDRRTAAADGCERRTENVRARVALRPRSHAPCMDKRSGLPETRQLHPRRQLPARALRPHPPCAVPLLQDLARVGNP